MHGQTTLKECASVVVEVLFMILTSILSLFLIFHEYNLFFESCDTVLYLKL